MKVLDVYKEKYCGYKYWKVTLKQDTQSMEDDFAFNAYVRWHNTNEQFNIAAYIKANCEYPNFWDGEIEELRF